MNCDEFHVSVFPVNKRTLFANTMSTDHPAPHWVVPLLQKLGIVHLREYQSKFFSLLEQRIDFSIVLPTGYGKSLAFTAAPFLCTPGLFCIFILY